MKVRSEMTRMSGRKKGRESRKKRFVCRLSGERVGRWRLEVEEVRLRALSEEREVEERVRSWGRRCDEEEAEVDEEGMMAPRPQGWIRRSEDAKRVDGGGEVKVGRERQEVEV